MLLQGLHGRLGDLCAIDARYDVAVSNGASGLDHIIADTISQAQAAVAFLRRKNLGIASFLSLDKIAHLRDALAAPAGDIPEGCERLFDLIKCGDERILPAVWWSVRHTLVAPDMATARRIAYGGRDGKLKRVVTLEVCSAAKVIVRRSGMAIPLCMLALRSCAPVSGRTPQRWSRSRLAF